MPIFRQPGDRAVDGLLVGLGQLFAMMGWATVGVGVSTSPGFNPSLLVFPGAGALAGMLHARGWTVTLLLEVVALSATAALVPSAQDWVWMGALVLGLGRLATWFQRRRGGPL